MLFLRVCLLSLLVSVGASPVSSPMIAGQVRLSDGSPVAGAQVVLFDVAELSRGPVGQATTDEAGQFALPLAAGGGWVLPSEVGLGPNYPNPFNPSTLIPYQLAATSPVRLEVFNVLGQRVATLVDEEQGAGAYRARWNGTDAAGRAAASGVYIYRLTVAGAHWTGKMVLVDGQAGVPLGGARVAAVPQAGGSTGSYGLVVWGAGLVAHVDSDFGVGVGSVDVVVAAEPQGRGKVVVPTLEGILGDVDNNGEVDLDDGLLVALLSVDPALSLPNHGLRTLGDVNCDGRVELEDAALLARYVANPSDAAVSSLQIGQPGGYSLEPVTEVVWGSILRNEQQDATVARLLDEVPVLLSGVIPIDGADRVYLGIDRDYWTAQGGKQLYEALKQRFPVTPIHVEPSVGVITSSGKVRSRPTTGAIRRVAPVTGFGSPRSFFESPHAALEGTPKQQRVVGSITVPDDVTVGTVAVEVDITHSFKSDLKIDLVAPSGVVTTLHDGVATGINPEDNIVGTLPATDSLQGQSARGTWHLRVGDYEREDTGTLNSWRLTITPASTTQETQNPTNLFLDTFQDGLDRWQGPKWEAASLDSDATVPGEGPGNIVAKTQGCSICFMTLTTPVDLSAHDSVTLSFYRWLDPGMGAAEFFGVDIGNNGAYQRLDNWSGQHADGQWHLETYTLTGDQISDTFTLRFFGITTTNFTTLALDNVMITAVPGSVIVTPEEPEDEETEEEVTEHPDLAVTLALASPRSVESGQNISFFTRVVNTGDAPAPEGSVTIYQHTSQTTTPTTGGIVAGTKQIPALAVNRSTITSLRGVAPVVSQTTTFYYYLCADVTENENVTDNNCIETPRAVTVRPKPGVVEEEPEEPEEPETAPILSLSGSTALPTSLQSTFPVTIQTTITNTGNASSESKTIRIYRHTRKTSTPTRGGAREAGTATTGVLAPNASVTVTSTHAAPTVTQTTKYYYYVCIENTCSATPAEVVVRVKPEDPGPPYERCFDAPERSSPMGGDALVGQRIGRNYNRTCGTVALGGLETETGEKGFIMSAHVVSGIFDPRDFTRTDALIGHSEFENFTMKHFLGRVSTMPTPQIEGEKKIIVDAAFVAYPTAHKPGCSLTWSSDKESFCIDLDHDDDYIERLVPLTIRGAGIDTYTVTGSQEPTEGLEVQISGATSGTSKTSTVEGSRLLGLPTGTGHYSYDHFTLGEIPQSGDSGGPVYTVPDASGHVRIVGVLSGVFSRGGREVGSTFSPWSDAVEEFDLKPISAPDSPIEEDEEDEEELAGLFSAFD